MLSASKVILFIEKFFPKAKLSWSKNQICRYGKTELPEAPKKPLSAFLLFCKEHRPNISKEKGLTAPEQIKLLAEKWRNLSPTSKKTYEDYSREEAILYGQKHKQYYESLTEEQRAELLRIKAERKESRKANRIKKALRESGIPKLPSSAYAIFLQEEAKERKEKNETVSFPEFTKEVAARWNKMPEAEKQAYIDQSRNNKELYLMHMKEWRKKLIQKGDLDLLRHYDEKTRGKKLTHESNSKSPKKKLQAE